MGLCLTTRGWTGASILVATGAGSDTYTVSGDEQNAGDVSTAFKAWLDAGARPWSASLTSIVMTVEDAGNGRLVFVYTTNYALNFSGGNAAWQARMAVSNTSAVSGVYGVTRGSCSAVPGTVGWERWDNESGARNRAGSWRTGHPSLSHRRPAVELALDLEQAYALNEAFRLAAAPRTAYLYDEMLRDYRMVTVGKHDLHAHRDDDPTKLSGTLDVLGGV